MVVSKINSLVSYPELKNIDFIGGITSSFTNSFSNIYVGSGTPNNQLLNISAYTQVESKVSKTFNLSAGARLEYFQLNDTITAIKPIFRAGSTIKLYQETYLRGSYGQGYRFPTITERFIKTGVGNFGVFPNPNLKPESSWNAEIGIKQGFSSARCGPGAGANSRRTRTWRLAQQVAPRLAENRLKHCAGLGQGSC